MNVCMKDADKDYQNHHHYGNKRKKEAKGTGRSIGNQIVAHKKVHRKVDGLHYCAQGNPAVVFFLCVFRLKSFQLLY